MPEDATGDAAKRSFIEQARRAQLVACAIDTIAEVGYARASLAQIARRARVSKGVISYHFAGKTELIRQVVAEVLTGGAAFMRPRIEAEPTVRGKLHAYIEANVAYMASHRNAIVALFDIVFNARGAGGETAFDAAWAEAIVTDLERLLRLGQEAGEFRAFSTRVMATAIRNAIDGIPPQLAAHADLDLGAYARELVTLFDLATRPPG